MSTNVSESGMLIQKTRNDSVMYNTFTQWGLVITNAVVPLDGGEAKDNGFQEFPDMHGNDVVDLDTKYIKAFDVEIPFACIGDTPAACRAKKKRFIDYLLTGGIQHKVYIPWLQQGRNNVEYKSESNQKFKRDINGDSVYTFTLKFTINDPLSEITADGSNLKVI